MNYLKRPSLFGEFSNTCSEEVITSKGTENEPEIKSWDKVEDSIECAIKTVEDAMKATAYRSEKNLSIPLRRLYNRSKKLRLARGKVLTEDKLDEENYIHGRCMLGKFISGSC